MEPRRGTFDEWLIIVKKLLIELGSKKDITLCEKSWKELYDAELIPFHAVMASEFDGDVSWRDFRKMCREIAARAALNNQK